MSSSGSSNTFPPNNQDAQSSQESISPMVTRLVKNPYIPWYTVDGKNVRDPAEKYWPGNDYAFTMQVSHSGNLFDHPGELYKPSTVTYFEAVDVNRLDLEELLLMSRRLGYSTMGNWYCMNDDDAASLELKPLRTEFDLACFRERVRKNMFLKIENVFVEHEDPCEYLLLPKNVMEAGESRIEKLVYLLLLSNPSANVDDGIDRVRWMTGITVPRAKMERAMIQAMNQLRIWMKSNVRG